LQVIGDFHVPSLVGAMVAQEVMDKLVAAHLPEVAIHLEGLGISLTVVTMQWLLSLYLTDFAAETALPVR
tara:strand:- start:683 stop:892 length:210 start_codon:yes stop_codon:yes gene_type:complete